MDRAPNLFPTPRALLYMAQIVRAMHWHSQSRNDARGVMRTRQFTPAKRCIRLEA
jgi:hypothetical protein